MTPKEIEQTKISIIVATYNRPDALKVCVRSIFNQTLLPMEIIVGDDGSRPETAEAIKELIAESPVPIKHVWHEDNGFRLAMMRNKSVAAAKGDYIIEIDGDIFLHPEFIRDHLHLAAPGHYVKGGRTNLGPALTDEICNSEHPRHIGFFTRGIESKALNSVHMRTLADYLAPRYRKNKSSALGCNMSFFKSDFLSINGYDEFFEGWGGEDWDLGNRFQRAGLKKLYLKFAGIVYHLWHEDKYMYNKAKNFDYMEKAKTDKPVYCENGVDKYIN